jgi:hypothetical protein
MASVDHPFQFDRPFQWQAIRRSPSDLSVFVCPNSTSSCDRCATRFSQSRETSSRRSCVRPTQQHRRLDQIPFRSASISIQIGFSFHPGRGFKTVGTGRAERRSVSDRPRTNGMITATAGRPSASKPSDAARFDLDVIPVPRSARQRELRRGGRNRHPIGDRSSSVFSSGVTPSQVAWKTTNSSGTESHGESGPERTPALR